MPPATAPAAAAAAAPTGPPTAPPTIAPPTAPPAGPFCAGVGDAVRTVTAMANPVTITFFIAFSFKVNVGELVDFLDDRALMRLDYVGPVFLTEISIFAQGRRVRVNLVRKGLEFDAGWHTFADTDAALPGYARRSRLAFPRVLADVLPILFGDLPLRACRPLRRAPAAPWKDGDNFIRRRLDDNYFIADDEETVAPVLRYDVN